MVGGGGLDSSFEQETEIGLSVFVPWAGCCGALGDRIIMHIDGCSVWRYLPT